MRRAWQDIGAAVLAGTPGDAINRCIGSLIESNVDTITVFDTRNDGIGLPSHQLREHPRVETRSIPWSDHFGQARNAALALMQSPWVCFIDADEWVEDDWSELHSALNDGMANVAPESCVYSPLIVEFSDLHTAHGVPRLLHRESSLAFRGRVHEYCVDSHEPERLLVPITVAYRVWHDGYEPDKYDQSAKVQRNLHLLSLDLQDDPGDIRSLYFRLRDASPQLAPRDSLESLRSIQSLTEARPDYTCAGLTAQNYVAGAYVVTCEIAIRSEDFELVDSLCDEMTQLLFVDDASYFRSQSRLLTGTLTQVDLVKLARLRRDSATGHDSAISPDGRHVDAMIVAALHELSGAERALEYWQTCEPWTDGLVENSWPRWSRSSPTATEG